MQIKKKSKANIEDLTKDDTTEVNFEDNPKISGTKIADFSFDNTTEEEADNSQLKNSPAPQKFKRTYKLTQDTIRKVDELKAKHPDLTTYVSNIVEEAINFYYDYINKAGF